MGHTPRRGDEALPVGAACHAARRAILTVEIHHLARIPQVYYSDVTPGSTISLRYYLKTNQTVEFFKVRLAAGPDKKVDYTVSHPQTNKWVKLTLTYDAFIDENPRLAGRNRIR